MTNQLKKLYRSREDRVIAGVAGGLGKYFDVDPVLIRVFFVLFSLVNGAGILLYLILMIVIPNEPGKEVEVKKEEKVKEAGKEVESKEEKSTEIGPEGKGNSLAEKRNIIGIIIIIVGLVTLVNQFFPMGWIRRDLFLSIAIIFIGFYIIFKGARR